MTTLTHGSARRGAAREASSRQPLTPLGMVRVFVAAVRGFSADGILSDAAAVAFYTLLSLAPLVVLLLLVLDALGGESTARLQDQVQQLVGPEGARLVETISESAKRTDSSRGLAGVVGLLALAFSASGMFGEIQRTLNEVWNVQPRPGLGWRGWLRKRLMSFAMLGVIAFLLLVSLGASTLVASIASWSSEGALLHAASTAVALGVYTLLFATVFKVLPDVRIAWRDVFGGACATACLFALGKWAIGVYLAHHAVGSAYGAAGSLVVVVVWVYFSSAILLFGAELTEAWVAVRGREIAPNSFAVPKAPKAPSAPVAIEGKTGARRK